MKTLVSTLTATILATLCHAQLYSITNATGRVMMSGWFQYGTIDFTGVSDDLPMIASSPATGNPIACMWSATTIMDDYVNMKALTLYVEGRHGYQPGNLDLLLRNQITGQFEVVASPNWGTRDTMATYVVTTNPARFVSPGGIVELLFRGTYSNQEVQCVDLIRFQHEYDNYGTKRRFHFAPQSIHVNRGNLMQGNFLSLSRPDDGDWVSLAPTGSEIDWQCEFGGVTWTGTFDSMELTLRLRCSSLKTVNVWLYNWRRSRWEPVGIAPRTFEWGNFRLKFNAYQNPLDFVSATRVRARFYSRQALTTSTDLCKLTVSVR